MGANAQTTVPTFTAGEVLTAAQQNASARTGVPVFATTGTRDAGFGGTGEKTLAEGQLCYVEGTGLQSYNGTSWVTWGTAPSSGALVKITSGTLGAVSTLTLDSVFTSTYKNYEFHLTYKGTNSGNTATYQYRASGATDTNANYNQQLYWDGASLGRNVNTATGTSCPLNYMNSGQSTNGIASVKVTFFSPQEAQRTNALFDSAYEYGTVDAGTRVFGVCRFTANTQFDGILVTWNNAITSGNYAVYGYAV